MKNSVIEQILLDLYNAVDYGFSYRAKKGLFISQYFDHWKKEDAVRIKTGIRELKNQKFIEKKENYDGSVLISLTEKGRLRVLNIVFKNLESRKEKWDGKWRLVASDIPEECRKGRDAVRYRFRMAGFYEWQKSLFIYPYDCKNEVMALIKLFKLEKYVKFALIESINDEDFLKRKFKLS